MSLYFLKYYLKFKISVKRYQRLIKKNQFYKRPQNKIHGQRCLKDKAVSASKVAPIVSFALSLLVIGHIEFFI